MNQDRSVAGWLTKHLPKLVFFLFLSQPLLDVLSYWIQEWGLSNVLTLALRLCLLIATLLAGFILSKRKYIYYIAAGILLLLTAGHAYACWLVGYDDIFSDFANLLRIYHFPLLTLSLITFLRTEPKTYTALRRGIFAALCITGAVELLSLATGTNPYTYNPKPIGLLGWFYYPSGQSAILSCAVPISLCWVLERWKEKPVAQGIAIFGGLAILFCLGTRLSFLAMVATGIGLVITLLIVDRSRRKSIAILLSCTVLLVAALPVSPMYRNQVSVAENAVIKQNKIDEMVAADEQKAEEAELVTLVDEALARLETAYEYYLGGLVHRFGLARVAQRYHYSEKASEIVHTRNMRINYCAMMLEDLPQPAKLFATLFGMEVSDMTYEGFVYDVENDLYGIFFLTGGVGLIAMLLFLCWFVFLIVRALARDAKRYFTLEAAGWGIAFLTCMTHVYATAGVLRRPNVSIYLSAILASIAFLVQDSGKRNPTLPIRKETENR